MKSDLQTENDNLRAAIEVAIYTIESFEGQEITYSIAMALAELRKQLKAVLKGE